MPAVSGAASGKTNIRMPVGLHARLQDVAEEQGTSLNAIIVALLAGGVGWKPAAPPPRRGK